MRDNNQGDCNPTTTQKGVTLCVRRCFLSLVYVKVFRKQINVCEGVSSHNMIVNVHIVLFTLGALVGVGGVAQPLESCRSQEQKYPTYRK